MDSAKHGCKKTRSICIDVKQRFHIKNVLSFLEVQIYKININYAIMLHLQCDVLQFF
jgi:hypothetical protein